MTWYAWTPISADKPAKVGEAVTADKLGISKEQFEQLIDSGSIREDKYPEMEPTANPKSPIQWYQDQAAKAAAQAELVAVGGRPSVGKKSDVEE